MKCIRLILGRVAFICGVSAVTVVLLALTPGCGVFIDEIEMPGTGQTNSSFQVGLDITCLPYISAYGYAATLMPEGWSMDTVYHTGGWTGGMSYSAICSNYLTGEFGEPLGYSWFGFVTENSTPPLDSFPVNVSMTIQTDSIPGTFWLAFHAGYTGNPYDPGEYGHSEPPKYGNEIAIFPLALVHATWGTIKAVMGD